MDKREVYLAPQEETAMRVSGELWNAMLDAVGPADGHVIHEIAGHIHALQRMILANVAARAFPEKYRALH